MAIDLAEAWGDASGWAPAGPKAADAGDPEPCPECQPSTGRRGGSTRPPRKATPQPLSARVAMTTAAPGPLTLEQALMYEIAELRREHAQRSSITIAILCLIAAALFLHMERVQAQAPLRH